MWLELDLTTQGRVAQDLCGDCYKRLAASSELLMWQKTPLGRAAIDAHAVGIRTDGRANWVYFDTREAAERLLEWSESAGHDNSRLLEGLEQESWWKFAVVVGR